MKCILAIGLLVTLTSVLCQEEAPIQAVFQPPKPVGVIYLIQLLNQPEIQTDYGQLPNAVPYKSGKFLNAMSPNSIEQQKENSVNNREKRSPSYGSGGGGICHTCGGGSGGYPGGGGGGFGGGGGHGSAGAWSQSSSSAGSFGSGGGYGKGKYGK